MNKKRGLEKFKAWVRNTGYMHLEGERVSFSKEVLDAMDDRIWYEYMKSSDEWRKKKERNSRCSVGGKLDKAIRCPEKNKCDECPYTAKDSQGNPQPGERTGSVLSLDLFEEMGVGIPGNFNVEAQIEKQELRVALHTALTSLSEDEYHIIILAAGGMPEQEIATRVDSKQRTINDQKRRIRTHLKKVLEDFCNSSAQTTIFCP